MPKPPKVYLGDAVYAEADDYGGLALTTEDGIQVTNRIVLESQVLEALGLYVGEMVKAQRPENNGGGGR